MLHMQSEALMQSAHSLARYVVPQKMSVRERRRVNDQKATVERTAFFDDNEKSRYL